MTGIVPVGAADALDPGVGTFAALPALAAEDAALAGAVPAAGVVAEDSARAAAVDVGVSDGNDGPSFAPTSRGQPTPIANPTAAMTPTLIHEG